jgi:hypothetical protein
MLGLRAVVGGGVGLEGAAWVCALVLAVLNNTRGIITT